MRKELCGLWSEIFKHHFASLSGTVFDIEFECPACACRHRAGQREMSAPGSTALDSGRTPLRSGQSSSPRFDSVAPACPSAARSPSLCSAHSESTVSLQVWDRISLSQSQGPESKRCLFQFSAAVPHLEAGVAALQQLRGVCVCGSAGMIAILANGESQNIT